MLRLHGQGSKSHCLIVHVEYNLRNVCLYCMHVPKCVLHERLPFLTILVLVSYICPINSMNDYNFNHYHSIFIARSTIAIWGSRRTDPPSFPLTLICFPLFPPHSFRFDTEPFGSKWRWLSTGRNTPTHTYCLTIGRFPLYTELTLYCGNWCCLPSFFCSIHLIWTSQLITES